MTGRYDKLKSQQTPKTLEAFADKHNLKLEDVQKAAAVFKRIEFNMNEGANIDEEFSKKYKRVRIGKLLVPRSFYAHCQLVCELMGITEETFWQTILMDGMAQYADKAGAMIDLANNVIKKESGRADNGANNSDSSDTEPSPVQSDGS